MNKLLQCVGDTVLELLIYKNMHVKISYSILIYFSYFFAKIILTVDDDVYLCVTVAGGFADAWHVRKDGRRKSHDNSSHKTTASDFTDTHNTG